jgi:hypothetical protein
MPFAKWGVNYSVGCAFKAALPGDYVIAALKAQPAFR